MAQATSGLLELANRAILFANAECVEMLTTTAVAGHVVFFDHVHHRQNIGDAARVKPDGTPAAWHIGHPICIGRACLCG
jgi:hypothetical protein